MGYFVNPKKINVILNSTQHSLKRKKLCRSVELRILILYNKPTSVTTDYNKNGLLRDQKNKGGLEIWG